MWYYSPPKWGPFWVLKIAHLILRSISLIRGISGWIWGQDGYTLGVQITRIQETWILGAQCTGLGWDGVSAGVDGVYNLHTAVYTVYYVHVHIRIHNTAHTTADDTDPGSQGPDLQMMAHLIMVSWMV